MDTPDISVYGEAKGEYTRQLCVFLVPSLESYVLGLLEEAKVEAPNPKKVLWQFQTILQGIPEWNQDKVLRETEKIQKDCNCDYLEELITAVFIAHTKVLSAIRLTTKQKKLQITIPKLDHFIHRLLSEAARNLWTNAYLFADCNSIEKQKNFRQVSSLLNDSVLQAIRGLLPVKSILKEYLHDEEEEDEEGDVSHAVEPPSAVEAPSALETPVEPPSTVETPVETVSTVETPVEPPSTVETPVEPPSTVETPVEPPFTVETPVETPTAVETTKPVEAPQPQVEAPQEQPVIQIDTKPSVTFSSDHVFFDSDSLDANEIQDIPFMEDEEEDLNVGSELLDIETDTL